MELLSRALIGLVLLTFSVGPGLAELPATDLDWITEAIDRHNEFRKGFSAPPLVLNPSLCKVSQAWADKLAKDGGDLQHSTNGYGENLYVASGPDLQVFGSTAVDAWYDEIKHFDFATGLAHKKDVGVGSFTQLVWKSTREVCVAYAVSENLEQSHGINVYVVASYYPPGNIAGKEVDNIFPFLNSVVFYKDSSMAPVPVHLSGPAGTHAKNPEGRAFVIELVEQHSIVRFPETTTYRPVNLCPLHTDEAPHTTDPQWVEVALKMTNTYRAKHGSGPLALNPQLCTISQGWANAMAANHELGYSSGGCGENVYGSSRKMVEVEATEVIRVWYQEIENYDFKHGVSRSGEHIANFTQLIWKATTDMCIATASTGDWTYVVAHFYPKGNVKKKYVNNVVWENAPSRAPKITTPSGANKVIHLLTLCFGSISLVLFYFF